MNDTLRQARFEAVLNHRAHTSGNSGRRFLEATSVAVTVAVVVATALVFVGPTLFLSVPRDGLNAVDDPVQFLFSNQNN